MIQVEEWSPGLKMWYPMFNAWTTWGAIRRIRQTLDESFCHKQTRWRLRTKHGFVYLRFSHTDKDVRSVHNA